MSLDNKQIFEAQLVVFEKEVSNLDLEFTAAVPSAASIHAQLTVLRTVSASMFETEEKLIADLIADGNSSEYMTENARRAGLMKKMHVAENRVTEFFNKDQAASAALISTAGPSGRTETYRINLPKRKLQEFTGDVREWLGFWSSFEDIDLDTGVSDADKFQYLLQCIPKTSKARKVIDGFTVSAKNYRAAVDTLKSLYGRDRMLIKVYVRDLLQLVVENATKGVKMEFMELYPRLSSYIRNLEELGVTTDKCEEILYPVVECCLPDDILLAYQRSTNYEEKLETLMSFLNVEVHNKMDRSVAKMQFSAAPAAAKGKLKSGQQDDSEPPTAAGFMVTYAPEKDKDKSKKKNKSACIFCGDTRHETEQCGKAKTQMTLEERIAVLKEKKCCFRCLRPGHFTKKCSKFVRCCICGGHHYELVCQGARKDSNDQAKNMMMTSQYSQDGSGYGMNPAAPAFYSAGIQQQVPVRQQSLSSLPQQSSVASAWMNNHGGSGTDNVKSQFANVTGNGKVTLMTFVAVLVTKLGSWKVRIFIDPGSEESYVEQGVAEKAGCTVVGECVRRHQLFGGVVTDPQRHPQFKITLVNLTGSYKNQFLFNSVKKIAHRIRKPQQADWMVEMRRKGIMIDDQSDAPEDVQLMIGMDIVSQLWTGGFQRINPYLYLKETCYGWVIGGTQDVTSTAEDEDTMSNMVTTMMNDHSVEQLWALEAMGIHEDSSSQKKDDIAIATINHFARTVKRRDDGRYVNSLPFKEGHKKLTSNFNQAYIRLKNTTKNLKTQGYWETYDKVFADWEKEDIIQEVPISGDIDLKAMYLLPHRHVIKEGSTTPVRPVFDASAKGVGGPSLNDCLEAGPNLLELIPAIMCRFRKQEVGVIADIKKAFLQIELAEADQQCLQFLWWQDSSCKQLKLYRHRRVVFGVKPSPFLLAATLKHHLQQGNEVDRPLREKLLNSMYVDNSCSSHSTIKEAKAFQEKSQQLLVPAKFDLRGWEYSHSKEMKTVSVLGMNWETSSDTLSLCLDSVMKRMDAANTKRGLLSLVNSVYDPMGFVSAFTIIPKLLLQDCCKLKLQWDEKLPEVMQRKLNEWKSQASALENMQIPRWISFSERNNGVSIHCFSDASGNAFAATIFVRTQLGDGVGVQLIMSKARVAPYKKKVTIPRLELLGCEIGALLTVNHVVKFLELENAQQYFWTDSTASLAWIQRDKEWARFVANRVAVIRKLTNTEDWHHVPGEMNPADVPSRGCSAARLVSMNFWEGPQWLRLPQEHWPSYIATANEEVVNEEKKRSVAAFHVREDDGLLHSFLRLSDYHQILRVMAYILRFVNAMKNNAQRSQKRKIMFPPSAAEITEAEVVILRWIQKSSFQGVGDKRLVEMRAFMDSKGLIRVKTQLLFGEAEFNVKCPVVLPHNHPIVNLIIMKVHSCTSHAGVQILQAVLREQYWILKNRRTIQRVINGCAVCRRFIARRCEVPAAPLPVDRVRDTVAFDVTGVDLAGPLYLRGGQKSWIVLFTCGVYRAVHLELVTTLSTEGFLNAFRRFVSRRGRPSRVYSDNGLNFVGAANLFKNVDWGEVERYAAVEKITWRFNPPTAAWWGGWWERLIGLTKQLIRRILGKKKVEYEEMFTILVDVEAAMNQRPLTYISDTKEELQPLCPANFLRDNPNANLPEADAVNAQSLRNSVKICQNLRDQLRTRFRKEYLGLLQFQAKQRMKTVKPRDVVIIEDDNKKRLDWSLGVVLEVYPGRDGAIRTALVRTRDGEFLRAVQRLFIMEASVDEYEPVETTASSSLENQVEPAAQDPVVPEENTPTSGSEIKISKFGRKIVKPDRLGINEN